MFNENTWKDGEYKVQEYMKNQGYKILMTNFSCVGVELDIVSILPKKIQKKNLITKAKEKIKADKNEKKLYKNNLKGVLKNLEDLLVITEVKARETNKYGLGMEQISESKKKHIVRGARFLQTKKEFESYQIRFDVASVDGGKITYIENAF